MSSPSQIREQITGQIIHALEGDVVPWRRPWSVSANAGRPANVASKRAYRGVNPLLLELHRMNHGFESKWWGTYRQWKSLGCQVMRRPNDVPAGEWGARIVFYKPISKTVVDKTTGQEDDEKFFVMRSYSVFNAEQVSGESAEKYQVVESDTDQPFVNYEPAEELIQATGADIHHGGEQAYYVPPTPEESWPNHSDGDYLVLPYKHRFDPVGSYYETTFHELAHWSEVRLDWDRKNLGYAQGELIAEISASFLATELGVPQSESLDNHAAYLRTWLDGMRQDASFIFKISKQASKVTDYLLSFIRQDDHVSQPEQELATT